MKNSLLYFTAITLLAFASHGCGLFQPHCKCEEEIAAAKLACPAVTAEKVAPFPSTTTDKDGNPKDLSEVAATHGGDIEPSSALETNDKVIAQGDVDADNSSDYDDGEEGDDELPSTDQDGLPDDITASQMDQILPSDSARKRIDIPDAARSAVQIPVLTSLKPEDDAWAKEILPTARETAGRSDAKEAGLRALTGNFLPHFGGKSTAIVTPGNQIEIDTPGRHTIKRNIPIDYRSPLLASLWPFPVYAAQLVNDDPLEIVVIGIDKEGESDSVIMEVYKVFGDQLGRIFKTEVGIISDNKIIKTAQIEFVSGKNDIGIRRTPIDSKGNLDKSNAVVYDWNHWEGYYRPNTAPERTRLGPPSWQPVEGQDNVAP